MYVNICSKLYETIYYLSVWECECDFLYLCVFVCVLHTCLSVALKCLTVLSCPQSMKSRKSREKQKREKTGQNERKRRQQRQEILLWIFCK